MGPGGDPSQCDFTGVLPGGAEQNYSHRRADRERNAAHTATAFRISQRTGGCGFAFGLSQRRQLRDGRQHRCRRWIFEHDDMIGSSLEGTEADASSLEYAQPPELSSGALLTAKGSGPRLVVPVKRRYLVRFDPKRIPHLFTDVLIIGGGIAGIRAALAVDPKLDVIVVTKDRLLQSNSAYAQGGIAGVFDPLDNFTSHAADTMAAGKGLCDPSIVDMVIREAPDRIRELIGYGAHFDTRNGEIDLTQEGGHSHRRIVHALGDATGQEVMRAMADLIRSRRNVQIWEATFTIDLLTDEGSCRGALVWSRSHGQTFIWAKQTVLATGGAGRLYRETTNPEIATADGHAIGFRAGGEVRGMGV